MQAIIPHMKMSVKSGEAAYQKHFNDSETSGHVILILLRTFIESHVMEIDTRLGLKNKQDWIHSSPSNEQVPHILSAEFHPPRSCYWVI